MERLFLAVPIPPDAGAALRRAIAASFPGGLPGRPVPPENWHLTLRFLGDLDHAGRAAAERSIAEATVGATFTVELGGWGAFPRPERARVVWMDVVDATGRLTELAAHAEVAARAAGLAPERKAFTPHLTVARLRHPADLASVLQRATTPRIAVQVRTVVLLRSTLGSGPPRYEAVARWPLSDPDPQEVLR